MKNTWFKFALKGFAALLLSGWVTGMVSCSDESLTGAGITLLEADGERSGDENGLWSETEQPRADTKVWRPENTTGDVEEIPDVNGGQADNDASAPGEFGYPCDGNEDCLSGFCVDSEKGKVCTEVCLENCPQGWECSQVLGLGGDVIYICVSPFANLCKPCMTSEDCGGEGELNGNACVDSGGNGYFCGAACEEDSDCPENYGCIDVVLESNATSRQCVIQEGACECTETFIQQQAKTTCYKSNENGPCFAEIVCGPEGLTSCEAPPGCINYWLDQDNDGYGLGVPDCLCEDPGSKYVEQGGDCNDSSEDINPLTIELCNGLDDNCDNQIDEYDAVGCEPYFWDKDGDGYGDPASPVCACAKAADMSVNDLDCDDSNADVFPDGPEACNGVDDDCDGFIDEQDAEGCAVYFFDDDQDDYGLNDQFKCLCAPEGLYSTMSAGDCDDTNDAVKPFAIEICDGIDNDCDLDIDDVDEAAALGCSIYYRDNDEDGFGQTLDSKCRCAPTYPYSAELDGDCDDDEPFTYPGAEDIPDADFVDANCDVLDGDVELSVFVDGVTGSDENEGTQLSPVQTIGKGIEMAQELGKTAVLVTGGAAYVESLTLVSGIGVYGRYTVAEETWGRSLDSITTVIANAGVGDAIIGVQASGIEVPTRLQLLQVQTANNPTVGGSNYGVYAVGGAGLIIEHCDLDVGAGGGGNVGAPGNAGENGTSGSAGQNGCDGCSSNGNGGSGGPSSCGANGGNGGNGGYNDNGGGDGGVGGNSGGSGGAGAGGGKDCNDPGDPGANGSAVEAGGDGAGGTSGGFVQEGFWYGNAGQDGISGESGRGGGGGGGGAGGPDCADCHWECFGVFGSCTCKKDRGGGGGGGGSGGCGGGAGIGGGAGGGSFGVFLMDAFAVIRSSEISTAGGGQGGSGGNGGTGGSGGIGTGGGSGPDDSGPGGKGGDGGPGASGGHGGGGAGGPSYGVYRAGNGSAEIDVDSMLFEIGAGGAGGVSSGVGGSTGQSGGVF